MARRSGEGHSFGYIHYMLFFFIFALGYFTQGYIDTWLSEVCLPDLLNGVFMHENQPGVERHLSL